MAVNRLVECKLIEKKGRGNRTNVYLIYPPDYFCEKELDISQGACAAPLDNGRVHADHPESACGAPSGCIETIPGVHVLHPKSTNKNTTENLTLKTDSESAVVEERIIVNNETEDNIELIKKTFKEKGVQVSEKMICALLKEYGAKEIKAAIKNTDFNAARNPLAVIKWMLSTGSYVIPVEKEIAPPPKETPSEEVDEIMVKKMIKEAREGLQNKIKTSNYNQAIAAQIR